MSVQSVCRWLRSKSYGDLAEYFEDENIDAEAVERLTKSADGGFAILRAICGIGVKANRLMKLMEDLKKQQESTSDQHSTLGIPNSQLTISMGTTTQHQEHLRKQQEEEEDAKKQQEEANTVDDDDENIANTNTMMENFQKAISHRSPSLLGVSSIKIKSFITSAAMLGSYSIVKMRCLKRASVLVLDVDVKLVNICQAERTKTLDSLVQQCSIPPNSCTQCSDHMRLQGLQSVGSKLESVRQWVDQSHYLPLYASGDRPVFGHAGNVAEAVNYFDGDGGSINVDRFPGLCRYLEDLLRPGILMLRFIASSRSSADCVMLAGPYPNTLKRLVSVQECVDQSSHLPLYASGDRQVFAQVGNVAAEAVNYFDGDGDSIRCGPIPGPSPLPPIVTVPTCLLKCTPATRRQTSLCRLVLILIEIRNGAHLLVEVYTCNKASDQFVLTGVRRVEAGLSFPTRGAPIWYNLALETARGNRRGVFQYGADMGVEELMPWVPKDSLADRGSSHSVRCGAMNLVCHGVHRGDGGDRIVVEVVTRDVTLSTFLVSGLSRVQCGFSFPVPNALRQVTCPYTPASFDPAPMPPFLVGRIYAILPLGNPHQRHHLQTMSCPLRDEVVYDPQVYDGHNIGRFVNKGIDNDTRHLYGNMPCPFPVAPPPLFVARVNESTVLNQMTCSRVATDDTPHVRQGENQKAPQKDHPTTSAIAVATHGYNRVNSLSLIPRLVAICSSASALPETPSNVKLSSVCTNSLTIQWTASKSSSTAIILTDSFMETTMAKSTTSNIATLAI
eukprot:Em0001g3607a